VVPLSFAVVGSGAMAAHHLDTLSAHPQTRPVALVSRHKERADPLATRAGISRHDTLEAALATHPEVSAVDIAHANAGHAPAAMTALTHGKHALIEKPVAFTAREVAAIAAEAAARRLVACAVLPRRFGTGIDAARRLLGTLRAPIAIHTVSRQPREAAYYARPERGTRALAGGGALLYHGIHELDMLVSLFGPVASASGALSNVAHALDVEDTCVATLRFAGGAVATLEVSTAPGHAALARHTVVGANRTLVFDDVRAVASPLRALTPLAWQLARVAGRLGRHAVKTGTYADVLHDFLAEVRGERGSRTAVATTVETHRVIEEIYAAARR
jgi:predicted dehydrogenase